MNIRTRSIAGLVGSMIFTVSGCGGGISIGRDDKTLDHAPASASTTERPDAAPPSGGASTTERPPASGGAGGTSGDGSGGTATNVDTGAPSCIAPDSDFTSLIELSGTLSASAPTLCVRKTATEELAFVAFRARNTFPGVATLFVGAPAGPDGACDGTHTPPRALVRMYAGAGQSFTPSGAAEIIAKGEQMTFVVQSSDPSLTATLGTASLDAIPTTNTAGALRPDALTVPSELDWIPSPPALATGHATSCEAAWHSLAVVTALVQPGQELFWCEHRTLNVDTDIGAVRSSAATPDGVLVDDVIVGVETPIGRGRSDGGGDCSGETFAPNLFGAASGRGEVHYADGAAPHIPAGSQLVLRLHLVNTNSAPFSQPALTVEYQGSP